MPAPRTIATRSAPAERRSPWAPMENPSTRSSIEERGIHMKSIWLMALLCVAGVVPGARPVLAHHSGAMFDTAKVVELKATVKELQWSNPHIWIQVVADENGAMKEWSLEGGSPNTLSRRGWRST